MLATLAKYKSFKSKITASYCVMRVTLIRLPFKIENFDQCLLFFKSDLCSFQNILNILYLHTHFE